MNMLICLIQIFLHNRQDFYRTRMTLMTLMTRICSDKTLIKIREDQCNPRYPRSMFFLVLVCPGQVKSD